MIRTFNFNFNNMERCVRSSSKGGACLVLALVITTSASYFRSVGIGM